LLKALDQKLLIFFAIRLELVVGKIHQSQNENREFSEMNFSRPLLPTFGLSEKRPATDSLNVEAILTVKTRCPHRTE
jgi:hypothetical protein